MTAIETIRKMRNNADSIRDTNPISLATIEVGDEHAQGDVNVRRVPNGWIASVAKMLVKADDAGIQIVPGSTTGSRHCLDSLKGVNMFRFATGNPLDLCAIVTTEARSLLHPEHAHLVEIPPGEYVFTAQRAFADTLRRAMD